MFNLAINSKLRGCDLVKLRVNDVSNGGRIAPRAMIMRQKARRPVQFEITESAREVVAAWIRTTGLGATICFRVFRVIEEVASLMDVAVRQDDGFVGAADRA